jgi:5-formyltetrahydrofolate cyclo-ligase
LKPEARRGILALRDALTAFERAKKSAAILESLKAQPEYIKAGAVLFYVDFRSEVQTRMMMQDAIDKGKRVYAPKVDRKSHRLKIFEVKDLARDLEAGYMGIYEPIESHGGEADPATLDMVVMPGVGFDSKGRRLGYGGGYYDRLAERLRPGASLIALAYDCQVVDEIPSEEHDKKVHKIITETKVIAA